MCCTPSRASDQLNPLNPANIPPNSPTLFYNIFPNDTISVPIQTFTADQVKSDNFSRVVNYVVTADGDVKFGRIRNVPGGGHVDLANGLPVQAAGEFRVANGQVVYADNKSGHYLPNGPAAQKAAIAAFQKIGIDISGKYIERVLE